MRFVILLYLAPGDGGVQPLIHVALLVAVAQEGALVGIQLLRDILLRLGKLLGCHVQVELLGCPGADVLVCEAGTVLRGDPVRDVVLQVGQVKLVLAHPGHHVSVVHEIPDRAAGCQQCEQGAEQYGYFYLHLPL